MNIKHLGTQFLLIDVHIQKSLDTGVDKVFCIGGIQSFF